MAVGNDTGDAVAVNVGIAGDEVAVGIGVGDGAGLGVALGAEVGVTVGVEELPARPALPGRSISRTHAASNNRTANSKALVSTPVRFQEDFPHKLSMVLKCKPRSITTVLRQSHLKAG